MYSNTSTTVVVVQLVRTDNRVLGSSAGIAMQTAVCILHSNSNETLSKYRVIGHTFVLQTRTEQPYFPYRYDMKGTNRQAGTQAGGQEQCCRMQYAPMYDMCIGCTLVSIQ